MNQQIIRQRCLLLLVGLGAIGLPMQPVLSCPPAPQVQAKVAALKTYTIGKIRFETPQDWTVRVADAENNAIVIDSRVPKRFDNSAPPGSYRLIAWVESRDLETIVTERLRDPEGGAKTEKVEKLTIGGKPATRFQQSYEEGFPNGMTTAIALDENQTAMVVTWYSDAATKMQAKAVHQSIQIVK
jgi:hypothetical protein